MSRVRALEEEDRDQIVALTKLMHAESKYSHIPYDESEVHWSIDAHFGSTSKVCFVCTKHDGTITGFVTGQVNKYYFSPERYAVGTVMFVLKTRRMTADPLRLLSTLERWAKDQHCDSLVAGASAPVSLESAMRFYKRIGYTVWGVMMKKELR